MIVGYDRNQWDDMFCRIGSSTTLSAAVSGFRHFSARLDAFFDDRVVQCLSEYRILSGSPVGSVRVPVPSSREA